MGSLNNSHALSTHGYRAFLSFFWGIYAHTTYKLQHQKVVAQIKTYLFDIISLSLV